MKVWTKDEILDKITTDDRWLARSILAIYERQTASEQRIEKTILHNSIGFSCCDARKMSIYAKQILAWQRLPAANRNALPLQSQQFRIARRVMRKYAGQLAAIANANL